MGRKILAVVVALIGAFAVIMIVQMLNSFLVSPPASDVMNDPNRLREYMGALPTQAYVTVLIGYILGSLTGGYIAASMSRRESPGPALAILVGVILTVAAVLNFVLLPGQALWFIIASLLTFVPVSLIGYKLADR